MNDPVTTQSQAPQPPLEQALALPQEERRHKRRGRHRPHLSTRELRRIRSRRLRRRAFIRSIYFLPSMATLGNAICGFAAAYITFLDGNDNTTDTVTQFFTNHHFIAAAYLIFIAMIFDGLDGRLARLTRHTTDFGGQLDSLSDVISFGVAPALLAIQVFKSTHGAMLPSMLGRLYWAIGALYMCCAAMRLARFNVLNQHGEQYHFSFLGLPSPGAGAAIAGFVLVQQQLAGEPSRTPPPEWMKAISDGMTWALPLLVLATGLLMISNVRYPHLINQYIRGKRSLGKLVFIVVLGLLVIIAHRYVLAIACIGYALYSPAMSLWRRFWRKPAAPGGASPLSSPPASA